MMTSTFSCPSVAQSNTVKSMAMISKGLEANKGLERSSPWGEPLLLPRNENTAGTTAQSPFSSEASNTFVGPGGWSTHTPGVRDCHGGPSAPPTSTPLGAIVVAALSSLLTCVYANTAPHPGL